MIVDEADKLINKYTIKKIELLRTIMDSAAVGDGTGRGSCPWRPTWLRMMNGLPTVSDFAYRLHGLGKAR